MMQTDAREAARLMNERGDGVYIADAADRRGVWGAPKSWGVFRLADPAKPWGWSEDWTTDAEELLRATSASE